MKLQVNGQHLRLRIDEDELQRLLADEMLSSTTQFPGDSSFTFTLRLHAHADAMFDADVDAWRVALPRVAVDAYVAGLPRREGLVLRLAAGTTDGLELGFEVDVRDSVRRRMPRDRS